MYSVLGRKSIAIRKIAGGSIIHTYHKVHRYPPMSDIFLSFGHVIKGPPLLHSFYPNTRMNGRDLISSHKIDIGDELTFDFSNFHPRRLWIPQQEHTHQTHPTQARSQVRWFPVKTCR